MQRIPDRLKMPKTIKGARGPIERPWDSGVTKFVDYGGFRGNRLLTIDFRARLEKQLLFIVPTTL